MHKNEVARWSSRGKTLQRASLKSSAQNSENKSQLGESNKTRLQMGGNCIQICVQPVQKVSFFAFLFQAGHLNWVWVLLKCLSALVGDTDKKSGSCMMTEGAQWIKADSERQDHSRHSSLTGYLYLRLPHLHTWARRCAAYEVISWDSHTGEDSWPNCFIYFSAEILIPVQYRITRRLIKAAGFKYELDHGRGMFLSGSSNL